MEKNVSSHGGKECEQFIGCENQENVTMSEWLKNVVKVSDSMDIDKIIPLHTDDVRFRIGNNETIVGKAAVGQGFKKLFSLLKSICHKVTGAWELENVAIVESEVTYVRKDGKVVVVNCATIFRKEGDLIKDVRIHLDISPLFQ
jgi:hypothetical protein